MLQMPLFPNSLPAGGVSQWDDQPGGYHNSDHEKLLALRRVVGQQQAEYKALQDKEREAQLALRELKVAAQERIHRQREQVQATTPGPCAPLLPR